MPRIAVLADVHGNVPALEAVLEDVAAQRVDEVLVGGDLVGRGPQGSRVVRRIQGRGLACVKGNHEDYLLSFRRGEVPADWLEADEWSASRWMAAELDETDAAYIAALPFSITARLAPQLRLVHGSPNSNNEGIGPWTSDREMARHLSGVEEPVLICAHTHRPLSRTLPGGLVINVGSVGLPFNRDRRAQYAIFEIAADGGCRVEHRQVDYDLARTLEIYERTGFARHGGITARLLRLELEQAAPFLVPFLKWAEHEELTPGPEPLEAFLGLYDPEASFRELLGRTGAAP